MSSQFIRHQGVQLLLLLSLMLVGGAQASEPVPHLIAYQGWVQIENLNFDGTGRFKFAITNADGTISYWSQDGTSTAGSEPTGSVAVAVDDGLFALFLGDTSLTGMSALPASVFDHEDLRLVVWFDDGVIGWQRLGPGRRLVATPFSMRAASAGDTQSLAGVSPTTTGLDLIGSADAATARTTLGLGGLAVRDRIGSAQIDSGSASSGQVLSADGSGGARWSTPTGGGAVTSVFGRSGTVTAAASDYDAIQIDLTPTGNIAAINLQTAIQELDSEKQPVLATGDSGALLRYDGTNWAASPGLTADGSGGLQLSGRLVESQVLHASSGTVTGLDVSGVGSIKVDTAAAGGAVTIASLSGGVAGQVLHIFHADSSHDLTISHANGGSGQDLFVAGGQDLILGSWGGVRLSCDGSAWYVLDPGTLYAP